MTAQDFLCKAPPRRGGVARQLNRSWRAGVVRPAKRLGRSSIEASHYRARASRHPVCTASPLAVGASSPPLRGGEYIVFCTALALILVLTLGASMPFQREPAGKLQTGLLWDDVYLRHLSGNTDHPERPERLTAIRDGLEQAGLLSTLYRIEPRRVTQTELELVHKPSYIDLVRSELSGFQGLKELSTGDTLASPDSLETAEFAAGGVLNVVDAVMTGKVRNAFAAVRPPGHHATPERGMGFCIFNNVAIAARYLQKKRGIGQIGRASCRERV